MTGRATDIVFRDVLFLALLGFVAIAILLLPHINPPRQNDAAVPPGNVIVEIRWPDHWNTDVDLWVRAPGDVPVGYSNLNGKVFNLLRDDLGGYGDLTGLNYENAYSRGAPAGEYVVNLHLYRDASDRLPVPVDVVVAVKHSHWVGSPVPLYQRRVELAFAGQEVTVIRFTLDKDGRPVGEPSTVLTPLRSPAQ